MANQTTYPRIYQFSPLTKAWRVLVAFVMIGLGAATIGVLRGQIPASLFPGSFIKDGTLFDLVEGATLFILLFAGLFFACAPQVDRWIRALVFIVCAAPLPFLFIDAPPFPPDYPPGLAGGGLLCAMGVYFAVTALNNRLVLYATSLDYRFFLQTRRVPYADIQATFAFVPMQISEATIALRLKRGKPLIISLFDRPDEALFKWLDSFPYEEQQAKEQEWNAWLSHPTFPRVYRTSARKLTWLAIGALVLGAIGAACIATPAEFLVRTSAALVLAYIMPIAMAVVVISEPRFSNVVKAIGALSYLGFLAALIITPSDTVTQGLPSAILPFLRAFGGFCVIHGLFLLIANLRSRLVLHGDRLEYRGFLTTRTVLYDDIVETFDPQTGSPFCISLQLKNGKVQRIINFGRFDPAFDEWINSLPNREAEESERERARLESDSRLGTNPDERMSAYRRDLKWLNWLWWPRVALFGWAFAFPRPYDVSMYAMLAVPVVVMLVILTQKWRWSMHTDTGTYPLGLGVNLAAGAALALFMRGMFDYNMFDWIVPVAWSAALALVLMLLVCWLEGRFPWKALAGAYLLYLCYAWGGLLFLNGRLDTHPIRIEPVTVAALDNDSKYPSVTVRRADGSTLKYKGRLKKGRKVGDAICLYTGQGAFAWHAYAARECPPPKR